MGIGHAATRFRYRVHSAAPDAGIGLLAEGFNCTFGHNGSTLFVTADTVLAKVDLSTP